MTASSASLEKTPQLEPSWLARLEDVFQTEWFARLKSFLQEEKRQGEVIYPPGHLIFNALNTTPFEKVRVVILGQDPYHGPGQAHGLSFSVPFGVPPPPSLVNIFKELRDDLGCRIPRHGNLDHWARQGVLLLNACLTVRAGQAGSHHGKGWEPFTDRIVELLAARETPLVFLLWGAPAQRKASFVDGTRHGVFKAPHPSPLSAHRGFFGSRPFSSANGFLRAHGMPEIDWQLPEPPA